MRVCMLVVMKLELREKGIVKGGYLWHVIRSTPGLLAAQCFTRSHAHKGSDPRQHHQAARNVSSNVAMRVYGY